MQIITHTSGIPTASPSARPGLKPWWWSVSCRTRQLPWSKRALGCQMLTRGNLYTHMLHVWYIYLHDWVILSAHVGKYSIHGAYGIYIYVHTVMILFSVLSWTINRISTSAFTCTSGWKIHENPVFFLFMFLRIWTSLPRGNAGKTMRFLPPMTGNGKHTNYKNCDDWGMVYHCFTHTSYSFCMRI